MVKNAKKQYLKKLKMKKFNEKKIIQNENEELFENVWLKKKELIISPEKSQQN